jgi:hypothetical protein
MSEVTVTTGLTYVKNGFTMTIPAASTGVASGGNALVSNVQVVGFAAHEELALGDVTTPGICWVKNLDGTNYIEIGIDVAAAFVPFLKLAAGDPPALFRFSAGAAAPYAKANTADVKLAYIIEGA